MKRKSLLLAVLLCFAIVLSACGSTASMEMDAPQQMAPAEKPAVDGYYGGFDNAVKGESSDSVYESDIYTNDSNKIIRTANLTVQTTEFDTAVQALNKLTNDLGGYFETAEVESGSYYNQYANRSAYYVVRIPKENFIAFRDGTGTIGHVYSISENAQDVGEVYYDTEARLATLTTKRDRLLALLEKADVMEDIISLENALADVQYDIDRHTATLRKYDSLIGFSTFYIRLNEVTVIKDEPSVKQTFGSRFVASLKAGFRNFGEGIQDFAIWLARNLIGVVIFAAIVVVVVIVTRRGIRRRRERRAKSE